MTEGNSLGQEISRQSWKRLIGQAGPLTDAQLHKVHCIIMTRPGYVTYQQLAAWPDFLRWSYVSGSKMLFYLCE